MPGYENYNYNTQGFGNDPLKQSDNSFGLANLVDDLAGGFLFGNPDASSSIFGELTGYNSQQREFAQQEYLTDKQNQWNSAQEQMKRAKEAGINPLTAAGAIAGQAGSASVPQVASNTTGAAGALNAVSGLANAITGGKASLAEAAFKEGTLDATVENLRSSAYQSLTQGGLNEWSARSIEETLPLITDNMTADYYHKLATIENTWAEYENRLAEHRNIIAKYDEIVQNVNTLYSQQQVNEAIEAKTREDARWLKADNDFWESQGYRRGDPIDASIRDCKANGRDPSFIGDVISDYRGKVAKVEEHVKAEESWNYRPTNAVEAAVYAGTTIGNSLRDLVGKYKDDVGAFLKNVRTNAAANREFNESFNDAKDDLYEHYRKCKRYYKSIKNSGNSSEVANAYMRMNNAKEEYDSFNEEKFANELIKSLMP